MGNKIENESVTKTLEKQVIELPYELQQAPSEIQESYVEWAKIDEFITYHPDRYFTFKSLKNNEVESIDLRGLPGKMQNIAKEKGISKEDLKILETQIVIFQEYKNRKQRLNLKWKNWLRKQGGGVFDWKKAELIEMFGRYMTNEEVRERLLEDGYEVTNLELVKFVTVNKPAINKKKLEFVNSAKDHFLATDAGRMESLAMLHGKFLKLFNDLYNQPVKSTSLRAELKALSTELRAIIEQARRELKGEEVKLTIDGRIDVTASLQANRAIHELSRKIPLHLLPIYLVAAKTNTDPNFILSSLVNSFYKNFNGFGKIDPNNKPPVTIDLIRNYDWVAIENYQKRKEQMPQSVETVSEWEEIPYVEQVKVLDKREILLNLIKQSRSPGSIDNE